MLNKYISSAVSILCLLCSSVSYSVIFDLSASDEERQQIAASKSYEAFSKKSTIQSDSGTKSLVGAHLIKENRVVFTGHMLPHRPANPEIDKLTFGDQEVGVVKWVLHPNFKMGSPFDLAIAEISPAIKSISPVNFYIPGEFADEDIWNKPLRGNHFQKILPGTVISFGPTVEAETQSLIRDWKPRAMTTLIAVDYPPPINKLAGINQEFSILTSQVTKSGRGEVPYDGTFKGFNPKLTGFPIKGDCSSGLWYTNSKTQKTSLVGTLHTCTLPDSLIKGERLFPNSEDVQYFYSKGQISDWVPLNAFKDWLLESPF